MERAEACAVGVACPLHDERAECATDERADGAGVDTSSAAAPHRVPRHAQVHVPAVVRQRHVNVFLPLVLQRAQVDRRVAQLIIARAKVVVKRVQLHRLCH